MTKTPDRVQVMIGLLLDRNGVPIAHEVLPGNTPDYLAFMETIQAVKTRFNLRRVVLVGDRGMANEKTIKAIEEAGYEYILGVKMRRGKEVQEHILTRPGRFKQVEDNSKTSYTRTTAMSSATTRRRLLGMP